MNHRTYLTIIFALISVSLFAQPRITGINYVSQDVAILSRNAPPAGIVYYWQGTTCGTSTINSATTYTANASGTYFLRDFISSGGSSTWGTSCASTIVIMPDMTPPVLSNVTAGPIEPGDNISATSNENGMLYLVPEGTSAVLATIISAKISEAGTVANVASTIPTTSGLSLATYVVYAVDASDNVSAASPVISVEDLTAPVLSAVTTGTIENGTDISATSNEDGMIFLVPNGTAPNIGDINTAKVAEATATSGVAVSLSTTAIALGEYIVYAIDGADNVSAASAAIEVADLTAPVLSDVSAGPVTIGEAISATSNEDGMIYLVPSGTAANIAAISSGKVAEASATAGVAINLSTTGIAAANYIVYAVDGSDNVSDASAAISVIEPGDGVNTLTSDDVQLYPVYVDDILNIKSEIQVTSAVVYNLQGSQVININVPTESINMSNLKKGIYIVSLELANNKIFTGKVLKK